MYTCKKRSIITFYMRNCPSFFYLSLESRLKQLGSDLYRGVTIRLTLSTLPIISTSRTTFSSTPATSSSSSSPTTSSAPLASFLTLSTYVLHGVLNCLGSEC